MSVALARFAELLEAAGKKVIRRGERIDFSCPHHDDETPSAGAEVGSKVPVVAACAACGLAASLPRMLEELGASQADMDLILGGKPSTNGHGPGEIVHHVYRDASGAPLLRKLRRVVNGKTYI